MSGDLFSSGEQQKPANHFEIKATEKVRYKNPPKSGQFKPGQSGNPKGRPKGAKSLKTRVENVLNRKVTVRTKSGTKKEEWYKEKSPIRCFDRAVNKQIY